MTFDFTEGKGTRYGVIINRIDLKPTDYYHLHTSEKAMRLYRNIGKGEERGTRISVLDVEAGEIIAEREI